MQTMFLVRHGESAANVDKSLHYTVADHAVPLSALGHAQARAAGEFLRNWYSNHNFIISRYDPEPAKRKYPVRPRIWHSPYLRTRETLKGILDVMGEAVLDTREHINLCEQQYGLFDGIPDDELAVRYPAEHAHYEKCERHGGKFWARMPLGESRFDVAVRAHQALGTFARDGDKHGIDHTILVTHGVTMRALIMQRCHLSVEWFEREPNPGNCSVYLIVDGVLQGCVFTPPKDLQVA